MATGVRPAQARSLAVGSAGVPGRTRSDSPGGYLRAEPLVARCRTGLHRAGRRCTVRGVVGSDVRFVKVLAEGVDDQREARARWEAAASGHLSFSVAEPFGWDEQTRASWYGA